MRLTGTRTYYRPTPPKMPPGLVELMEGLTKDVLKNNPSDIYSFCASHMEQLLEKRDGPSRKKTLSLKDKIKRAQEQVRQKAEKRRQEYDRIILAQTQSNDIQNSSSADALEPNLEEKTSIVLHKNNAAVLQDVQKTPTHHNLSIDKFSEVEISLESESEPANKAIPIEKSIKSEDNKLTNVNIKQNDVIDGYTNADSVQSSNEETEINQDTSENNTPDTVIVNDPVVHLEIKKTPDLVSDMPSDRSVVIEQSNGNANEDVSKQNVEIIVNQEDSKPGFVMEPTPNPAENILKEEVQQIACEDNTIKIVVENHNQKSENTSTPDVQKSDDFTNIHESNNGEDISSESSQMPTITFLPPDTSEKDSNSIELSHDEHIDSSQNLLAESLQLPTLINNLELSDNARDTSDNASQGNNISITPGLKLENSNFDQKSNLESIDNEKTNEPLSILETGTPFDLPSPDIDHGIQTLMTENTSGEVHQSYELNNDNIIIKEKDTPLAISDVDKNLRDLDKVTSNNVDLHDIEVNSADAVVHASSDLHNDDTDDGKVEILTDVSDNTQTYNHDGNTMDLETAAVTIQKVFRNFLFKSRGSTLEDTVNDEANFLDEDDKNKEECDFPITSAINVDRRAHGITRMDTVLQTVNEEKSLSLSDDSSTLSSAATIIQAHVRGFLVRNKLNSNKTVSTNSLAASASNEPSTASSLDIENNHTKNKTVLNIHIGGDNYLSRDESLITSMDLSLDSPPSSINLHPLGYDKSERRKQLKREDAIQSISPPSNNSGKLSEDVDSIKELSMNDRDNVGNIVADNNITTESLVKENSTKKHVENESVKTATAKEDIGDNTKNILDNAPTLLEQKRASFTKTNSDEMDVVTPFITNDDSVLIHSGEFHDAVLPTRVSRSDTSVVSEFKNVLVYFLFWNHT